MPSARANGEPNDVYRHAPADRADDGGDVGGGTVGERRLTATADSPAARSDLSWSDSPAPFPAAREDTRPAEADAATTVTRRVETREFAARERGGDRGYGERDYDERDYDDRDYDLDDDREYASAGRRRRWNGDGADEESRRSTRTSQPNFGMALPGRRGGGPPTST